MSNELKHYGVLGMKWGIRRYQPYSVKPRESGKGGREIGKARQYARELSSNFRNQRATSKAMRKARRTNVNDLSDNDLNRVNNRLNQEENFRRLTKTGNEEVYDLIKHLGLAGVSQIAADFAHDQGKWYAGLFLDGYSYGNMALAAVDLGQIAYNKFDTNRRGK